MTSPILPSRWTQRLLFGTGALLATCLSCNSPESAPTEAAKSASPFAPEADTAIRFQSNTQYDYVAHLSSHVSMAGGDMIDLVLDGKLVLSLLSEDPATERQTLRLSLVELDVVSELADTPDESGAERLIDELVGPFSVKLDRGVATEMRLPQGMSRFGANIVLSFAGALQLPRQQGSPLWEVDEYDATGPYRARYERAAEPGLFHKRKLSLEATAAQAGLGNETALNGTPRIVSSAGTLKIEAAVVKEAVYAERLSAVLVRAPLESNTSLKLSLSGTQPRAKVDESTSYWTRTQRVSARLPFHPATPTAPLLDAARIGQRTFESTLAAILRKSSDWKQAELAQSDKSSTPEAQQTAKEAISARGDEFRALAAIFRQQPEAVDKAERAIRQGSAATRVLLNALGTADTARAETALISVAADESLPAAARRQASTSILQLADPEAATLEAMLGLLSDPTLHTHTLYAVGSLTRRLRQAGESELTRRVDALLKEQLATAEHDSVKIDVLRGIANSGGPGLLDAVRPLAKQAPTAEVRGAALEAMRLMDDPRVDQLLSERIQQETDPGALRAAVNAAKVRRPSDVLMLAVGWLASESHNAYVRRDAIKVLQRWLPEQPGLRTILKHVSETDPSHALRATASAAL